MSGLHAPPLNITEMVMLPGTFIAVLNYGLFLQGPSGIGKSDLALTLINRGHSQLIADDSVNFRLTHHGIYGSCPPLLQDFLEIRGLGILNVRNLLSDKVIKAEQHLDIIIQLTPSPPHLLPHERLRGHADTQNILNVLIPSVSLSAQRNLPVLIETVVRNHALRSSGYDASQDFQKRQHELLTTGLLCD